MAPSTKKRKEPPLNRTLLDFFSSPSAVKRAKVRTSQQLTPGVRPAKVASTKIVVINSDSDEAVHEKENGVGCSRRARDAEVSEELRSPNSADSEDKDPFGVQSALLRPPNPWIKPSSNGFWQTFQGFSSKADQSASVSGILLEQTSIRNRLPEGNQTNSSTHENTSAVADGGPGNDLPDDELPIGEWAVGDDELVPEMLDSTGAEVEHSDEQLFCPVCGLYLTSTLVFEAETHVNQCLDATTLQNNTIVVERCSSIPVPMKPSLTTEHDDRSTALKGKGNLYTTLMNSHKENDFWVEADGASDRDFKPTQGHRRKAPFYKVLQGMPIAVDAFCYGTIPGVTAYFLTHAHSDHYTNLGSRWKSGPIYCSEETANLIIHMLGVDPRWIYPLPLDTPTMIPNTGGVNVTLIEANHCPGSCLFFFEGRQTIDAGDSSFKTPYTGSSRVFRYLHCGDFRASPRHVLHPAVNGKHIDHIYLDTTYLDPKYIFPPQPLVISACAELARKRVIAMFDDGLSAHISRNPTIDAWMKPSTIVKREGQQMPQERVLVIVGTYSIGKERIVRGGVVDPVISVEADPDFGIEVIAQALGTKVYCDPRKTAILRCQADGELHALLTADPVEADVHILPLGTVTLDNLRSYLQRFKGTFSRVIGFRPTGWTYSPPPGSYLDNGSVQSVISNGQSRHFSYTDLQPSQKSSHNIQIYSVPYSEHSSFLELTCFAMSCDWGKMIPTVNVGNPTSRAKMTKWLKRWELEKRCTKPTVIPPRTSDYW